MELQKLIHVVEGHAEVLAKRWIEKIKEEAGAEAYLRLPETDLQKHVTEAYKEIGVYLDNSSHEMIQLHFRETGRRRYRQNLPLQEVIRAIQLARVVVWQYVLDQGMFDTSMDLYKGLTLYRKLVKFFDWAVIYCVEGYFEASRKENHLDRSKPGLPIPL